MRTCLVIAATAALSSFFALPAQTASFARFGSGCPGSGPGGKVCKSANGSATAIQNLFFSRTTEVAIEVKGGVNSALVTGFEILTKAKISKVTVTGHIYLAGTGGRPLATPAGSGTVVVDTKLAWYRVNLSKPLLVKPGNTFFLSWTDPKVPFSQNILWPVPTTGAKAVSYHRDGNSGAWTRGPFSVHPWAWRVLCPSSQVTPEITNTGLPVLGKSYSVDLAKARAKTAAVLITGFSNTTWGALRLPFSLKAIGGGSCNLLVSYDLPIVAPTGTQGDASLKIGVPNDSRLAGARLHHQWLIVDKAANQLGFAFTRGGTATLGK